jgi:hypothetical protein
MNKLEGKRTFISLAIILAGTLGIGDLFTEGEVAQIVDVIFQIVGLAGAVYGRLNAKKMYK